MMQTAELATEAIAVTFDSGARVGIKNAAATATDPEEVRRHILFRSAEAKAQMGVRTSTEVRGFLRFRPFGSVDGGSQGRKECRKLQVQQ
jgi:hypothetical protein